MKTYKTTRLIAQKIPKNADITGENVSKLKYVLVAMNCRRKFTALVMPVATPRVLPISVLAGTHLDGNSSLRRMGGTDETPAAVAKIIKTNIDRRKILPSISPFDEGVLPAGK